MPFTPFLSWRGVREPSSLRRLFAVSGAMASGVLTALPVYAEGLIEDGLDEATQNSQLPQTGDLMAIIAQLVQVALQIMGVIFLILIIYAGIQYMLARGEKGPVNTAVQTIQNAVIGLAIVLAAYAITTFIFNSLIGAIK